MSHRISASKPLGKTRPRLAWPVMGGLIVVGITVGYPLLMLLLQSVFPNLMRGSLEGMFRPYAELWAMEGLSQMWVNSLACGASATLLAWVLGTSAGWLLARTDIPGKTWLRVSLLIPVMSPAYLLALAYVLIFQPNGLSEAWGIPAPDWMKSAFFSFGGVVMIMTLTTFGAVALLVESALLGISTRMEDAAQCMGTPPWRTFRSITLPLLLPALINAGILVFIDSVSNFGIAAILAPRANLPLLPEVIYEQLTTWPVNLPLGSALSTILAVTAMGMVFISQQFLATRASVNGRIPAMRLTPLKTRGKGLGWLFFGVLFLLSSALPVAAVVYMSLIGKWHGGSPAFTLEHYANLFKEGSSGWQALSTSLLLSLVAATLCVVVGSMVAYALARHRGRLVAFLDQLAVLPRIVPNLVVAVALILAWNVPWSPLPIYGTVGILLLAYVALYQATALRFADAAMHQITPKLEQAAACLGVSRWRILWGIILPMMRPSLFVAWITIVIMCLRDWVASIMLLPPGVQTVGSFIFNQFEQGDFAQAMAMTVSTVVLSTVLLVVTNLNFYRKVF